MERLKKNESNGAIYFAAIDPVNDVIRFGEIGIGSQVQTGLPMLYTSTSQDDVYDMAYSSWEMVEEDEASPTPPVRVSNFPRDIRPEKTKKKPKLVFKGVPRAFEFTPYAEDEYADLDDILADINDTDDFKMVAVERPGSNGKLLAFSEFAFSKLPMETQTKLQARKDAKDGKRIKKKDFVETTTNRSSVIKTK